MRISYEGDKPLADALLPEARHAFVRTKAAQGARSGQWKVPLSRGHCIVTLGRGVEGIHIVAIVSEDEDIARVPRMYAGVTLDRAQLYQYKRKDGSMLLTLDAYNMTEATKEEYNYKAPLVLSAELPVVGHVSMPTRMDNVGDDTQYTVQLASLYTGKMSKLVQVVQSYGIPKREEELSRAMTAIAQANPSVLFELRGSLFSKGNLKGVQNQFNWEYQRTHGIFEHTFTDDEGNEVTENWLIEIATDTGVRAMPLQLEPVTTTPYFKAYIASQIAKDGHKKFYEDIQLVLDTFGGYPTNEGFLTKHKDKIITLISPGTMEKYEKGRGTSTDIGWAFNDKGTMANNVCLEERGEGVNCWFMAHHCQISIGYDHEKRVPTAQYAVLESGSTPIGHGKFKVYDTAFDRCVSYNMQHLLHGDSPGRPKANGTAMHVFYKNDKLIVLRYDDGSIDNAPSGEEKFGPTGLYPFGTSGSIKWGGFVGMAGGFYCDAYDGRLETYGSRLEKQRTYTLGGEQVRGIAYDPAWGTPEQYYREFRTRTTDKTTEYTGSTTWDNCAFLPLGDRSAFYITNMVTAPMITESQTSKTSYIQDPYSYVPYDTSISNWDYGTQCGRKYPFKYAGSLTDGIEMVVWDRSGASGKVQLDYYCQFYIFAPWGYIGSWRYPWSQRLQDRLDQWRSATGKSEWFSIGAEPITGNYEPNLSPDPEYSIVIQSSKTKIETFLYSLGKVGIVFERQGSYSSIYRDYRYWFDPSPNIDGAFQTMWARRNCFGTATYQLWSTDVNDSRLATDGTYPLTNTNFPTFIGVVGPLAT